ncbi:MAG: hypothetical protein IJX28_09265 [Clostridia bacterium]|nr:hypothetical protein [Clostridia bacterium]
MNLNSSKRYVGGSVLLSTLLGVLAGVLLLCLNAELLLTIVFVIMGIVTVCYQLPGITVGLMSFSTKEGKITLFFSALSAIIGFLMIFWHSQFLMFFLGAYLLVFPLLQILLSKEKKERLKTELPKIILGVVMLLIGPAGALGALFKIAGWAIILLSILYGIVVLLSLRKKQNTTGGRIFADTNGDGKIDTVFVDTTGDGKADSATRYFDEQK